MILKQHTFNIRKIGKHIRKEGLVLRKIGDEFVTHRFDTDINGKTKYYWGHYFKSYEKAVKDFIERKL